MSELSTFNLTDLMRWVEEETGCVVSFHELLPLSDIPALKLPGEMYGHHSPFCEFVKLQGNISRCLSEKQKSLARSKAGRPFENICRYGVWDLVYPVVFEGETVGVLYLGGLRTGQTMKSINGKTYSGPKIASLSAEKKIQLKHWGKFLADFVILLLACRRRFGEKIPRQKKKEFYAHAADAFIHNHYREDIHINDLAAQLSCHPNYLGRMIQRAGGKSFRRLLTEFRVEKARPLLAVEHYTVTDAASACGFSDSNYFSAVFHRLTGGAPKEFYRRYRRPK